MDLAGIRLQTRVRLGGSSRQDLTSGDGLTALDYWINSAYRELAVTFRFHELEREDTSTSTVADQAYTTVPSSVYSILSVYDVTSERYLNPLPGGWEEYERSNVQSGASGKPKNWVHFDDRIYYKPIPDAVLSIRLGVRETPAALSATNDTPVLPDVWHDALVILATRNGWKALDEEERATAIDRGEFPAFISRVRTPKSIEQHISRPRGVRVRRHIRNPGTGV